MLFVILKTDIFERCQKASPNLSMSTMERANRAPSTAPKHKATTGTHEYHHSEDPFPGIGTKKCTMRGDKSCAGFNAGAVVPPPQSTTLHKLSSMFLKKLGLTFTFLENASPQMRCLCKITANMGFFVVSDDILLYFFNNLCSGVVKVHPTNIFWSRSRDNQYLMSSLASNLDEQQGYLKRAK